MAVSTAEAETRRHAILRDEDFERERSVEQPFTQPDLAQKKGGLFLNLL